MTTLDTPSLVKTERQGVAFYTDELLFKRTNVRIAFSCREGGVSLGGLSSLNIGSNVSDDLSRVGVNRHRLLDALGAPESGRIAPITQVHGSDVCLVGTAYDNNNTTAWNDYLGTVPSSNVEADAIVVSSNASNTIALLSFADCIPIILVAPDGSFAVVHAGWRGVYNKIVAKSVQELLRICPGNTSPSDLNAYIGPYIHKECFEVSSDLIERFSNEFGNIGIYDDAHIDLGSCIKATLIDEGISSDRIADLNKCTVCNQHEFYSHRATGGKCGRHGAVAFKSN